LRLFRKHSRSKLHCLESSGRSYHSLIQGQFFISCVAWAFMPPYSYESASNRNWNDNKGWRIVIWILGVVTLLMVIFRVLLFTLCESPRFLVSKGRYVEAVAVLRKVASINGTSVSITADGFKSAEPLSTKLKAGGVSTHITRIKLLFTIGLFTTSLLVMFIYIFINLGNNMFTLLTLGSLLSCLHSCLKTAMVKRCQLTRLTAII
jgi:MFS family permease